MKKLGKIIGGVCLGAFAASLIPYCVKRDDETGALEVRSLLWAWKKTPVDGKIRYSFAMPPSNLANVEQQAAASENEAASEAPSTGDAAASVSGTGA